jgi:hypothetical protein
MCTIENGNIWQKLFEIVKRLFNAIANLHLTAIPVDMESINKRYVIKRRLFSFKNTFI